MSENTKGAAAPQGVADERQAFEKLAKQHAWDLAHGGARWLSPMTRDLYLAFLEGRAALAAAPAAYDCWACRKPVTMDERSNADGDCPHCGSELDLEDWPVTAAPASTPEIPDDCAAAPVQAQEPVKLVCTSCGTDRLKDPCPTTADHCTMAGVAYFAPVQPVAVPDGEEFGFKAVRLRRTAFLLGLEGAIPDNDKDLMDCMGAVLGMICREVERLAAPAAQGDAKDGIIRDLNSIGMKFAAALVDLPTLTSKNIDWIDRENVMCEVNDWRTEWDKISARRAAIAAKAANK